ncbi:MAG: hypothetical protein VB120_00720 [Lachnospiraceae bacterium]|nr:hypothetical protein [Lachnospiraceae bacterium]
MKIKAIAIVAALLFTFGAAGCTSGTTNSLGGGLNGYDGYYSDVNNDGIYEGYYDYYGYGNGMNYGNGYGGEGGYYNNYGNGTNAYGTNGYNYYNGYMTNGSDLNVNDGTL